MGAGKGGIMRVVGGPARWGQGGAIGNGNVLPLKKTLEAGMTASITGGRHDGVYYWRQG